jgi:hypothetical protein
MLAWICICCNTTSRSRSSRHAVCGPWDLADIALCTHSRCRGAMGCIALGTAGGAVALAVFADALQPRWAPQPPQVCQAQVGCTCNGAISCSSREVAVASVAISSKPIPCAAPRRMLTTAGA